MLKTKSLTPIVKSVMLEGHTEAPFSGDYNEHHAASGTYLCRQCGYALFRAESKFASHCGWPSFDATIPQMVDRHPDADGVRTELRCANCHGHLGHEFYGEAFTPKNLRQCINSVCLDFIEDEHLLFTQEAIFAGGCFWGVEHFFKQLHGVVKTEVGYIGGELDYPDYERVCQGDTGHYEAVRVVFNSQQTCFKAVCKYFFEIHDAAQANGQGPDIGQQYQSAIFYYQDAQKHIARNIIHQLQQQGITATTKLLPMMTFWPAETMHQHYYAKTGKQPYCHRFIKHFD